MRTFAYATAGGLVACVAVLLITYALDLNAYAAIALGLVFGSISQIPALNRYVETSVREKP